MVLFTKPQLIQSIIAIRKTTASDKIIIKSMFLINKKTSVIVAILILGLIYMACICIVFSQKFYENSVQLSLPVLLDLLITAPVAYFLITRRTTVSKISILRVFMIGVVLAGILLSKNNLSVLTIIKTWVSPLIELSLISFVVWKFYITNQRLKASGQQQNDFLMHCRAVLTSVLGSEKIAHAFASEIAVFYYVFSKRDYAIDYKSKFTGYKENGILLVLYTFLCLFIIETVGMHFLFILWNKTAAWIFTSLSMYTCLQLFAHIQALKSRPHVLTDHDLLLRNGLMGGDALILHENINKIEKTNKLLREPDVVKIALIKGLENHNLAIHLIFPVIVTKAFGIKKTAKVILVRIDNPKAFIEVFESYKTNNFN